MTKALQEPNPLFPLGIVITCPLIQCLRQLHRTLLQIMRNYQYLILKLSDY